MGISAGIKGERGGLRGGYYIEVRRSVREGME